jgi:hypothetical protein
VSALGQFLGSSAGLSPAVNTPLTEQWKVEQRAFAARDLSAVDYVYLWANGIHVNIRLEEHKLGLLVMIGVRADGHRDSAESWADFAARLPPPGGSRVQRSSLGGGGARLCPSGLATSTPQTFPVAYRRAVTIARRKFPPRHHRRDAPRPAQIRQVRAGGVCEGRNNAGSSRTPFRHARQTRTIWQCCHAPALSGLLPPSPGTTRIRLPPASPPCYDRTAAKVSHLYSN